MEVGDRVIVSHEIMDYEVFRTLGGVRPMQKYAGEVATITHKDACGIYHLDIDDGDWWWNDSMLITAPESLE